MLLLTLLLLLSTSLSFLLLSPPALNGTYTHSTSSFTYMPGFFNYDHTINIVVGNPINGCKTLEEPVNTNSEYTNNVVLLIRGDCYFYDKVVNVQKAGGIGVLIGNLDDSLFTMNARSDTNILNYIEIPAMMISNTDYNVLYNVSLYNSSALTMKLTTIGENYNAIKVYIDSQLGNFTNEYSWIYWLLPAMLFILVQVYIYYRCVQSNWWQQVVARWTLRNHAANNPQAIIPPVAPDNNNADVNGYQALSNNNRNV